MRRGNRAFGKDRPVLRNVTKFDPLAISRHHDDMLADNRTAAQALKSDRSGLPRAGMAAPLARCN